MAAQTEQLRFANDDLEVQKNKITKKNAEVEKKAEEFLNFSSKSDDKTQQVKTEIEKPKGRSQLRQILGKEYFILKRKFDWFFGDKKWALSKQ